MKKVKKSVLIELGILKLKKHQNGKSEYAITKGTVLLFKPNGDMYLQRCNRAFIFTINGYYEVEAAQHE